MALSERLAFLITANGQTAIREFEKVGKAAEKNLGKADQRIDKFATGATHLGAGMIAFAGVAGGALLAFAKASEEANKSHVQLQAVLANTPSLATASAEEFEKLAQSIQNKTAADGDAITSGIAVLAQFGLTAGQLRQLTPLLVDYARFTGKDMRSAAQDLGKALLGQARALKAVGINFTDTKSSAGNFAELIDGLRGKVGGFAEKEGQTLSGQLERMRNQFQDLAEGIGGGVVGAINDVIGPVSRLTKSIGEANPEALTLIGRFASIGTAGIGAVGGLSLVAGQLTKLRDRFTTTSDAGITTINTFGKLASGVGVAAGLIGIADVLNTIANNADRVKANVAELARETDRELVASFDKFVTEANSIKVNPGIDPSFAERQRRALSDQIKFFKSIAEQSLGTARRLSAALKAQGEDTTALDKIIRNETRAQKQANSDMRDGADAAGDLSDGYGKIAGSAANAAAETYTYADALASTLGLHLELDAAEGDLSSATQQLSDDLSGVGDSASASAAKVYTFQDAMHDTFDSLVDANEAALDYEDSVDALGEALGKTGLKSEDAAAFMERFFHGGADDANHDARTVQRATDKVVKSAEAEVDAMVASGEIADTAAARKEALRKKLVELQQEFPAVAGYIQQYIDKLDKIPNLTTKAEDSTAKLSKKKKDLKADIDAVVTAADKEATALEGNGTEIDKATRHHFALLAILTDLKQRFPELAGVIQDYVNDVNSAYEDFLREKVGTAVQFAPGSFGLGGDATGGSTTSTPSGSGQQYHAEGLTVNNYISGDGLHSDEVADLVTTRTKRALVGSRVA